MNSRTSPYVQTTRALAAVAALAAAVLALTLSPAAPARAQGADALRDREPPRYNQVDLTAEAGREVANDLASAMMVVELTDSSAAAAAAQVTKIANEALRVAQSETAVHTRTAGMSTVPVYEKSAPGRITAWRARSEIYLESRDLRALSDLIGKLQSTLSVGYVNFSVSPEARRHAENELITQAIEAFRARAEVVRQAISGKAVRIRHLSVNTGMSVQPRIFAATRAASAAPAAEPPQFEAGSSQVQVNVAGTVEIE